ncbi:ATP-binding protein, partial [Planctomycetota bacterium]
MDRESHLLLELQRNSDASSLEVDYWSLFRQFRSDVSPELSKTDWLFPEFTPHDEDRHIRSLLRLTDELLGEGLISRLNVCEQFILACSLYGHDWGMAVSRDERDDILLLAKDNQAVESTFCLLPDEANSIRELMAAGNLAVGDVTDEVFRDYVRQTHPARGKCRINAWFHEGRRRLGEAIGVVSEGHWYDIEQVRKLSRTESVDSHTVNLVALTAYMRLIDLLDIAENRTPYKLWKFINPRDPFSAMEWKKHEALSPVKVEQSPGGNRVVLVHGSTDDYRVEANLEDMRRWCEKQFNDNRGLFVELGDRFDPALSWVEWKVEAIGFTPAHVRFDFDRDRTFDLIAAEIYENDPFVFLRELTQNAIDAILLRRDLTSKIDSSLVFTAGLIEIEVVTDELTPTQIHVKDNGIGMDLDTVRRYLAVAGRSYYRSSDFDNLNLSMSPISRFGIGLLSCFMVANELKIASRKDRLVANCEGLAIEIPHIRHQFHIRGSSQDWTGTKVSVLLCEDKVRELSDGAFTVDNICEFVQTVAGLSPVPIRISHNGVVIRTLPAVTFDENLGFAGDDGQPRFSLNREVVFGLTNVDGANAVFGEEKRLAIRKRVVNFDIEATVAYLERRSDVFPLPPQGQPKSHFLDTASNVVWQTKWKNKNDTKSSVTASWETNHFERVFMNGILVPNAELQINWGGYQLPEPRVTVNIKPSNDATRTSVSRRTLTCSPESIGDAITDAFDSRICGEFANRFESSTPKERVLVLSRVLRARHMNPMRLAKCWSVEQWPIPVFTSSETRCELVRDIKAPSESSRTLSSQSRTE